MTAPAPAPAPVDPSPSSLRVDRWLWYARFFRSRSFAAKLCQCGGVRVNGALIEKPHHPVHVGDELSFPQGNAIRSIRILALGQRRGPAPEASQLYVDMAPPSVAMRPARQRRLSEFPSTQS